MRSGARRRPSRRRTATLAAEQLAAADEARATDDVRGALRAHTDFHFAIYAAARSPWLVRLIRPAWDSSERFRPVLFSADGDLQKRHRAFDGALLKACVDHDPDAAAKALYGHLELANEYYAPELKGRSIFI